jgi:hypothetical protein
MSSKESSFWDPNRHGTALISLSWILDPNPDANESLFTWLSWIRILILTGNAGPFSGYEVWQLFKNACMLAHVGMLIYKILT